MTIIRKLSPIIGFHGCDPQDSIKSGALVIQTIAKWRG